jgi:hypothetical protein
MQALAHFATAVDWAKLWAEQKSDNAEPPSDEAELAALLREIPAKDLAAALAGKFEDACDEQGRRLLGEACWLDTSTDLHCFAARLWELDPVKFVTKVPAVAPFDPRDVGDLVAYELALAVLQAFGQSSH